MKKLITIGMAGTVIGTLLYTPSVNAKSINNTAQIQTSNISNHGSRFQNTITFLEEKLKIAAANQNSPAPLTASTPSITELADFFPANTPLLAFVNTDSETWGSLNRFQLFHMIQEGISQLLPKGVNTNFDYVRDVQSWLGEEIGIGILPKVGNTAATIESSFVIIAPVRNDTRLQSFIDVVQQDKQRVKVRKYNNATIYEINTSSPTTKPTTPSKAKSKLPTSLPIPGKSKPDALVIASLNGYVALSFSAQPIERIVDTKSANVDIIGQKPEFKDFARRQSSVKALYSMYQNPVEYAAVLNDLIKDLSKLGEPMPIPNLTLLKPETFKQYKSITSSITQQPEGLRFQVQTFLNPNQNKLKSGKEGDIVQRMPGVTYSALTGSNVSLQWQVLAKILSASIPEFSKGLKEFRSYVKTLTGLDFDQEIIGWMDGEYGFFLYPTKGGFLQTISPNLNLGIGLVVKTTNRNLAENTLNKLGDLIKTSTNGEVVAKNNNVKGQTVTSWDAPSDSSKSLLAYSWVDKDTLILTSGYGAITDLVPRPKAPLGSNYNFSNAISSLPYPNQGYFYVNTGSFLSWVYSFVPTEYQSNEYFKLFKQAAGSVYSLSATTSKINQGENLGEQLDFLITLAPTRKPNSKQLTN